MRIPWTKLLTTEQVNTLAKTDKELLSHVKSRKLRYFSHAMRQPQDSIENSMMTRLVEGSRSVDKEYASLTTSRHGLVVGVQIAACHKAEGVEVPFLKLLNTHPCRLASQGDDDGTVT